MPISTSQVAKDSRSTTNVGIKQTAAPASKPMAVVV